MMAAYPDLPNAASRALGIMGMWWHLAVGLLVYCVSYLSGSGRVCEISSHIHGIYKTRGLWHSDSDGGAGGHRLCLSSVKVFFFSKWEEGTAQTESKPLVDSLSKLRRDLAMEVEFGVTQLPYLTGVKVCRKWCCGSSDTCQQLWPTKSYCVAWPIMPRVRNGEWCSRVCIVCTWQCNAPFGPGAITSGLGRVDVGAHL